MLALTVAGCASTTGGAGTRVVGTSSTAPPSAQSGAVVDFDGVTVIGGSDLKHEPRVTARATHAVSKLEVDDLVRGTGAVPPATASVRVQYVGVLYSKGTPFDSSWERGMAATFPLDHVIAGFREGIAGTTGIAPMHVGGRRIVIIPAALGYGSAGNSSIPPNAPLVFVVDLLAAR